MFHADARTGGVADYFNAHGGERDASFAVFNGVATGYLVAVS